MQRIFIEITCEELPAIPLLKELKNIKPKMQEALKELNIEFSDLTFNYTPRRFVFAFNASEFAKDSAEEFFGAPYELAYKDGNLSQAGKSFLNKLNISESELSFKEKNSKKCLYYQKICKGQNVKALLESLVNNFICSLSFGRSMRWGVGEFSFIRPIKSLCILCNDELVDASLFGVRSNKSTFVHRNCSKEPVNFASEAAYYETLKSGHVILSAQNRKNLVLEQIAGICKASNLQVEIDEDLLDEVVAITEYPNALLGEFDKEFLEVAPEVIVLSMKDNQRYFAVYKDNILSNHFIAVSNSFANDLSLIKAGNEKVLRARLSDALFFWRNDLKVGLEPERLAQTAYMNELGTMADKAAREEAIALSLAKYFGYTDIKNIKQAAKLAKADLRTQMVGEFPELQGVVGGYYAAAAGANVEVATAIKEQYLPAGKEQMPSCQLARIIALASKFESLLGLFSIGKQPSGNKDPYALRRAALGVLRIVVDAKVNLPLDEFISSVAGLYKSVNAKQLISFINDRFAALIDVNPSVISAVLKVNSDNIFDSYQRIIALKELASTSDFAQNLSTFKRLVNIIKDQEFGYCDVNKLQASGEKELYKAYKSIEISSDALANMRAVFALKPYIDKFFDEVMINVDDASLKANRLALIGAIASHISCVADLKEINFDD